MRRRTFMRFVACCVALLPVGTSVIAAEGVLVSGPIVHDNLAIYFVHGQATRGAVPVSLEEALANGRVKVRETGTVNELTVENVGNDEIFIQAGDIVKGGRQDRVLSVDLLLPPRSGQLPIAAFCVESGRWSARGQEDSRQFSTAAAAMPSHEAKLAIRSYMAAAPSTMPIGQANSADPSRADTGSRQEQIWLKAAQAAYMSALQSGGALDHDVIGYVAAINGKISGGDVYSSPDLFRKMWPKLLAASVTEAISDKAAQNATPPSAAGVGSFMTAAVSVPESERVLSESVRVATRDGDGTLYAETRRPDGGWVHRNYLAK